MIVNTTRIHVRPDKRMELFQTILPLLEPISKEKGCVDYRCYVELTDENSALLISEWEARADWDNHLKSRDFAILCGALSVLANFSDIDFRLLRNDCGALEFPNLEAF